VTAERRGLTAAGWWAGTTAPRDVLLPDCSYVWDGLALLVGMFVAGASAVVLALSVPVLRSRSMPAGEYCFLLACSMTGGVVLGASRDLITLVIALETLTLPLYPLVGLRRRSVAAAEAAVTFFVTSVVSAALTLLGAALLYAATGTVHFGPLSAALASQDPVPLVGVGVVLVVVGLAFKGGRSAVARVGTGHL
jgi:NADH-quinone oxidoreductase subunit N